MSHEQILCNSKSQVVGDWTCTVNDDDYLQEVISSSHQANLSDDSDM